MINIQIEPNDYKQDTQVRENVVQGICEAFLADNCWNIFHPFRGSNRGCRNATTSIVKHKGDKKYYGFMDEPFDFDEGIRFNTTEMRTAFEVLIKAGYHMFKIHEYGSWMGYKCCKKPFLQNGEEVFDYNDFID